MTVFATCRSCAARNDCDIKNRIRQAIKGQRITSIKHTCHEHRLAFEIGQAVWAKVQQCPATNEDGYHGVTPSKEWFPAHFIDVSMRTNTRGLVFVAYEAPARDAVSTCFYPVSESDRGAVCKVLWQNIEPRNAPPARACPTCHQLEGMKCEGPDAGFGFVCPMNDSGTAEAAE